ncbi:hypothetical protein O4215_26270 [Rhodococcus maanshanensis]|uniref:hypothetical protein n=1 Tax=Rhodococcus maanshanensis TaxID=183556 RepID=UPI0022B3D1DB|nr:hypothetical protein [Rhodococcus maanshanensis]MCZ4559075.1 hypothetical protein [Rhodococcus maanshanensis]
MISRTAKTLGIALLVAAGSIGATASVAQAEIRSSAEGTQAVVCVHDGKEYSVGSKIYLPDGSYQTCESNGQWRRVMPG